MAQFPRVTLHLEMTSTDLRHPFDDLVDASLSEMDAAGKQNIETFMRAFFGEHDGTEVKITRLDVSHDLDEREQVAA